MINFYELNPGDMFYIASIHSYPKMKTEYGYIDMRDKIKITRINFDPNDVVTADINDVRAFFCFDSEELENYKEHLLLL